jgi:L-seryl-tRNA(Ser) seleniumtransferase
MTDPRRHFPAVERLLGDPDLADIAAGVPRSVLVECVRAVLADARRAGEPPAEGWPAAVERAVTRVMTSSLRPVVNATGVVLHTNLGRAPLPRAAIAAALAVASGYASLEFDLERWTRGSRHEHCRAILRELTGADDALVVNNAAGALLLTLAATSADGESVVSRGELVEIGGSFRIPDIIAKSGATLREVGTTNRTHQGDYAAAIGPATRSLLKVHRSNFRVDGFTAEVSPSDLAATANAHGLVAIFDLGSGLMLDLAPWGLTGEPSVRDGLASGADFVIFSGDKLLGGPQAGIVLGSEDHIGGLRRHPLARALRADKVTLAALEATLRLYRDAEDARTAIPTLRMLTLELDELARAADALRAAMPAEAGAAVEPGASEVGGGAFAGAELPTRVVTLQPAGVSASVLQERLRRGDPTIITRVKDDRVLLDPRTVMPEEFGSVGAAVAAALADGLSSPRS